MRQRYILVYFKVPVKALTNSSSSLFSDLLAKCLAVAKQTRFINASVSNLAAKYLPNDAIIIYPVVS